MSTAVWDTANETKAKEVGIAKAHAGNWKFVDAARTVAVHLAGIFGDITIDDVRAGLASESILAELGITSLPEVKWGNWAGSVFKDPKWTFITMRKCEHTGGHRRKVSVWRLKA